MRFGFAVVLCLVVIATTGCATRDLAARAGRDLALDARAVYRDEPDLELARVSGYSNLKLLETLQHGEAPERESLLALAEGFAGAALIFAEDDLVAARCAGDDLGRVAATARVRSFYGRARDYALRALQLRHAGAATELAQVPSRLQEWLAASTDADDADALLWYAVGALGVLGLDASTDILELGRQRAILTRVVDLDGELLYGTPHLALATLDASVPVRHSAVADRGAASFARVLEVSEGRYLLARVERARTLLVARPDREEFEQELESVLAADPNILPGERLLTVAAQHRARRLLDRSDALFASADPRIEPYHGIPCEY